MLQNEEVTTDAGKVKLSKETLIIILVCAGMSTLFLRTGFLSIFYLIPIGYAITVTASLWHTFFIAAITNLGLTLIFSKISIDLLLDTFYITIILLLFILIMSGKFLRTAYRMILASIVAAVIFLIIVFMPDSAFSVIFLEMSKIFFASSDYEALLETAKRIFLCGGAVASMLFMFYINRQLTLGVVFLIKRKKIDKGLAVFFTPVNTIWVLIGALATVVLTNLFKIEILVIASWNILVICGIIYLVQGTGILMYFLSRLPPGARVCINILLIVVIVSPFGTVAIGSLLLLGIVENFRPIRRPLGQNV